ncbi:MAG TPA: NfeD family protein [Candidatus Angelobacter sp.]|nr:NfeD family protein [Candidatus Angelobacter sp.]
MSWELFYLICFAVGFLFSVLSFLGGATRLHLHVPKHLHFGGMGHAPAHGHFGGPAPASHAPGHGTPAKGHAKGAHFSFFNPMTLAAFLTWFGGTGYLLERFRHIWVFTGLVLSSLAGVAGASIVFWFVAKVLMANERELDPLDYEMVGVLGKVSSSIRSAGTGEIIFSQEGVRRPCAARCETGESLAKGVEVVVTRYERGIAYVRPWDELADSAGITATQEQTRE